MSDKTKDKSVQNDDTTKITIKIGMIGEAQVGKTCLMIKYIEDKFGESHFEGVNFMEKTIKLRNVAVVLSIWDLGKKHEYRTLMPLLCKNSKALLFVFDLTRKKSLSMIREWYKRARKEYKTAIPFLVGTKYDLFVKKDEKFRVGVTTQARKFAKAMRAVLIYCSSSHSINIKIIFKLILARVLKLRPTIEEVTKDSEPLVEYKGVWAGKAKKSSG